MSELKAGAMLVAAAACAAIWWLWQDDGTDSADTGATELTVAAPLPGGAAPPMPTNADSAMPAGLARPDALAAQVAREPRDAPWAGRSETAIAEGVGTLSLLDREGGPKIYCAATMCEVRGTTSATSADAAKLAWQELEQFTQGDALTSAGLLSAGSQFGTREAPRAFTLYYRRDDSLTGTR